ncbi:MAG: penicillin-binding transpeptidase domain-containing protein [bacterium]
MFKRKIRSTKNAEINPEDIFLDSSNLPHFDTDQFEGRIEKPIPAKNIVAVGIIFTLITILYIYQIASIQIIKGGEFKQIAENNHLNQSLIFSERGAILDRYGRLLAWNTIDDTQNEFSLRSYRANAGTHNLLGYIKYPQKDKSGFYYNTEITGADGIEKYYNSNLLGQNGIKIVETDVHGKTYPGSLIKPMVKGQDLVTTIDVKLQEAFYSSMKDIATRSGFKGGAGVIMDVNTGEVLVSVSFPEYDSNVMTDGKDSEKINSYLTNSSNLFLDRVSDGLYTPGSIIKPIFALGALNEGIITPEKQIESTGQLKVPNPYQPGEFTIFKDWKVNGWTDMRKAIAVSSDVYFYEIGGGFPGQKGLGIDRIDKYAKMFGFGSSIENNYFAGKAGTIPTQEWKKANFNGDIWRLGDTYHTAIGQYGFQITPIQAVRAVCAIANGGYLIKPVLTMASTTSEYVVQGVTTNPSILSSFGLVDQKTNANKIAISDPNDFRVVKDGMRMTVTDGTMKALDVPYVKIAGKTGTAQLGTLKKYINSWAVGFWPAEKPRYAFAVMMEKGPSDALYGSTAVMRLLMDWMNVYGRQYLYDYVAPKSEDTVPVVQGTGSSTDDNSSNPIESTSTSVLFNKTKLKSLNSSGGTSSSLIEIERPNSSD